MAAVESPDLIKPTEGLLKGVAEQQNKNSPAGANQDFIDKSILETQSNAYKLALTGEKNKAAMMQKEMAIEGLAARQKMDFQGKQDLIQKRLESEKAKSDYENFFTMSPELADGIYKSTGGKLDFRKSIGQRMKTNVVIPLAQLYRGDITNKSKPGGGNQKDLNALKAFTKQYEGMQKQWEDPMKVRIARSNPETAKKLDEAQKYLKEHREEYDDAVAKMGKIGGLEINDDTVGNGDSSTPPPTSNSDEDALIDAAFQ